jgi:cell fate (sporulation/competence/biofilm development) regulator YlbF (YheA/YmcA/DUF963 family)
MSIDTAVDADSSSETDVKELASELGETITQLSTYQRFVEAKEAVENNEKAQEKVRQFEAQREEFMLARQNGNATNEDLRELQAAQEELHDIPVMSDFLEVQSELELELQELNEMISAPLAIDFGEKAGGCCQD